VKHRFTAQMPSLKLAGRSMTAPVSVASGPLVLVERPQERPSSAPRRARLIGATSRRDAVMCPVYCVSHEAVSAAKRLCRHVAKPLVLLRSGGISSILAALDRVAAPQVDSEAAASSSI